jgi:hypothetical protein
MINLCNSIRTFKFLIIVLFLLSKGSGNSTGENDPNQTLPGNRKKRSDSLCSGMDMALCVGGVWGRAGHAKNPVRNFP